MTALPQKAAGPGGRRWRWRWARSRRHGALSYAREMGVPCNQELPAGRAEVLSVKGSVRAYGGRPRNAFAGRIR
jgi:hypothetical protein